MIQYGMLHCHSENSLLDSPMGVSELVKSAAEKGCPAVALTDHGVMTGIPSFVDAAREQGIRPIVGVEAYVEEENEGRRHLIILAKNQEGYKAISRAVTQSYSRIYTDKLKTDYPRMNKQILLENFGPGTPGYKQVFFLSACIAGPLCAILCRNVQLKKNIDKVLEAQNRFISPDDRSYRILCKKLDEVLNTIKETEAFRKTCKRYTKPSRQEIDIKLKTLRSRRDDLKSRKEKMDKKIRRWTTCQEKIDGMRSQVQPASELYKEAVKEARFYKALGDFYIEIQNHGMDEEVVAMTKSCQIAREEGIPIVATNDVHYAKKEAWYARQCLISNKLKHWCPPEGADKELHIKDDEEMAAALSKIFPEETVWEAIRNIEVIANQCEFSYSKEHHYPVYPGTESFEDAIVQGIKEKEECNGLIMDAEHRERLDYEKKVIQKMGFVDYFMNVRDIIRYAGQIGNVPDEFVHEIPSDPEEAAAFASSFPKGVGVGPGRGSAVGSLVSYVLGITQIDPLQYGLLFERFLNEERVTMPDIDLDIRPEVIPAVYAHLQDVFGEMAVSKIITNTRFQARESVNAAKRVLGYRFPNGYKERDLRITSEALNGRLSSRGIHAAGVIISDSPNIGDYIPMLYSTDSQCWAVQCDMIEAESHGLLKMDLLKLICLSICNECILEVSKKENISIDWDNIPYEEEVFSEIYAKGRLDCVFQCESVGMQKTIVQFGPDSIEDLILLVAAFRPGPMDFIPEMTLVKHGKSRPSYCDPRLEAILGNTYGAIIYQEQVMKIFQELAGYSMGDADLVRRAMSKKKMDKLIKEKKVFVYGDASRNIPGCIKNGVSEQDATDLFDRMTDFAKYAFNRSHAVAYAIVSYRTAYLKYHYPAYYLCAYLNHKDDAGKIWKDCSELGIQIEKPDVNLSEAGSRVVNGNILLGFSQIKQVSNTAGVIVQERKKVILRAARILLSV